jgi:hypothetical protein
MQQTWFDRLCGATRAAYDRDRRENPDRFIGSDDGLGPNYLFVANVARMLGCNVDHVRRIPRDQLPVSRVGTRLIYSRRDVETYIAGRRDTGASRVRQVRTLQRVATASNYDPVAHLKELLGSPK